LIHAGHRTLASADATAEVEAHRLAVLPEATEGHEALAQQDPREGLVAEGGRGELELAGRAGVGKELHPADVKGREDVALDQREVRRGKATGEPPLEIEQPGGPGRRANLPVAAPALIRRPQPNRLGDLSGLESHAGPRVDSLDEGVDQPVRFVMHLVVRHGPSEPPRGSNC